MDKHILIYNYSTPSASFLSVDMSSINMGALQAPVLSAPGPMLHAPGPMLHSLCLKSPLGRFRGSFITTHYRNVLFILSEKQPLYLAPINRLKANNRTEVAAGTIKDSHHSK
jgi:hypothetical protein